MSNLQLSEAMSLYRSVYVTMHSNVTMYNLSLGLSASAESFDSVINCSATLLSRIKFRYNLSNVKCYLTITEENLTSIHVENKRLGDGNRYWDYDILQLPMPLVVTCEFIDFFDMRDDSLFYSYEYAELLAINGSIAGRSVLAKFDLLKFEI